MLVGIWLVNLLTALGNCLAEWNLDARIWLTLAFARGIDLLQGCHYGAAMELACLECNFGHVELESELLLCTC